MGAVLFGLQCVYPVSQKASRMQSQKEKKKEIGGRNVHQGYIDFYNLQSNFNSIAHLTQSESIMFPPQIPSEIIEIPLQKSRLELKLELAGNETTTPFNIYF